MAISIPTVRNQFGATTADIVVEQIALCTANLRSIEEIAQFRKPREKRDEINRRLRCCHTFMGMAGERRSGCLYREKGLEPQVQFVCEHVFPVTALVSLFEDGHPIEELVFFPIAPISKASDRRLAKMGLIKSGHCMSNPFLRYSKAGIAIETHFGDEISCDTWTIKDHWSLLNMTPEMAKLRKDILDKLASWRARGGACN